jgi:L-proline amide hydrolase
MTGGSIVAQQSVREGEAGFRGWKTWYRVTGDLKARKLPLVLLHGGPGASHDYLEALTAFVDQGRAVIHYDQLGCGRSTHLADKGGDFWTPQLFVDELNNLIDHLGIRAAYHVLGQSWGGMLGAEFAVTRPKGLRALVIANSPASMVTWVEEANRLRDALPREVQATLLRHEKAGTTSDPDYTAATRVFYDRHLCRVPWTEGVKASFAQIEKDPTVYHTMNGPSEFHVVGTLKTWSIVERLDRIEVPTLVVSGRHDEATPACVKPYVDRIKGARWELFENSSHLPHVEETDRYMKVVGAFLDAHDGPGQ